MDFVDKINTKNHVICLYDNADYKKIIQYQFIKKGLNREEHCIYFTHDDVKLIEKEMMDSHIDVNYYKQKKLLHIYQIKDIMNYPDGLSKGFEHIMKQIISDSTPPFWIVGRIIPDMFTVDGMEAELKVERLLHENFSDYECSFLCSYNLDEFENKKSKIWLKHLLKNHHSVIYAVEPTHAVAFDLNLLCV